jgi:hypothetical protein
MMHVQHAPSVKTVIDEFRITKFGNHMDSQTLFFVELGILPIRVIFSSRLIDYSLLELIHGH